MNTLRESRRGTVALVGAGPGDPELLTLKALRLLQAADAVAYDLLLPRAILELAPPRSMMISVGRRDGQGPTAWPIHPKVIELARNGLFVVRLKCGDPMIFGRGGEESEALSAAGIPFELVPGVTAAAAAGACGFSLTHRDLASSVTFATGHDAPVNDGDEAEAKRWQGLVSGGGTLVLYMAGKRIDANAERLIRNGMPPASPAACVAAASRPEQEIIVADLQSIGARTSGPGGLDVCNPILMIVGPIVAQRGRVLQWIAENRRNFHDEPHRADAIS
jgi:uroporphyrin-III C-methyltransferase